MTAAAKAKNAAPPATTLLPALPGGELGLAVGEAVGCMVAPVEDSSPVGLADEVLLWPPRPEDPEGSAVP